MHELSTTLRAADCTCEWSIASCACCQNKRRIASLHSTKIIFAGDLPHETFSGTPWEIIRRLRGESHDRGQSESDFLNKLVTNCNELPGGNITLTGSTFEERCESFIKQAIRYGICRECI